MVWHRIVNWRFWILIAATLVDGAFFVIPLVATALVVCALMAPDLLRRVARFLEALATAGPRRRWPRRDGDDPMNPVEHPGNARGEAPWTS